MGRLRSWVWILAVVTAGCGRIGYDEPTGDDDDDAATDGLLACPGGTVELCAGTAACIEIDERGYATWTNAVAACAAVGRRLCTGAEWDLACPCATGLNEMFQDGGGSTLEWEWVAEESGGVADKRGHGSCTDRSAHAVTDPYDYRCCVDR